MRFDFIEPHWIFDEYAKAFPLYTPSIFVQEQMLGNVTDRAAWTDTVRFWAMNQYRPQSVGKMLEYYDKRVKERDALTSYNHVRNQPTQRQAIAEEQERVAREIEGVQ